LDFKAGLLFTTTAAVWGLLSEFETGLLHRGKAECRSC